MHLFEHETGLILFFSELNDYDDIEIIADRFEKILNAKVLNKLDGPYSRVWDLEIDNEKLQLIADDSYGSSLKAVTESSKRKLKELIPKIETFIN